MTTPERPPTGRDKQREQTHKRLFDAALQVFRRDGVAEARVEEIAKLANVSRGTFYFHFPTKDDVLLELLDASEQQIAGSLHALPDHTPIQTVLDHTAKAIAGHWQDDPALLREIGTVALKATAMALPDPRDQHPVQLALIPRFHSAHRRGEVGDLIPPELLSEFFLVNLFGAALAWCAHPLGSLEDTLSHVVGFFIRAASPAE